MDSLVEVLNNACSQDPNVLGPATTILEKWESERGFYMSLFDVYFDYSLPTNVRWMAVLHLKNFLDSSKHPTFWQSSSERPLAPEEKQLIRQRLMANITEPVDQLAPQLADIIGKISRHDYPKEWSDLIPILIDTIKSDNLLAQRRAILVLRYVIKEQTQKYFNPLGELSNQYFGFFFEFWKCQVETFCYLVSNDADVDAIRISLENSTLLLRILRNFLKRVNTLIERSETQGAAFLRGIIERMKICMECRKKLVSRNILIDQCDTFVVKLVKCLQVDKYLICTEKATLDLCMYFCFTDEGNTLSFEKFIVQWFNVMNLILEDRPTMRWTYERTKKERSELRLKMRDFFTADMLAEMFTRLILRYLPLTMEELELWESDPETFEIEANGKSKEYNFRPCTESLFRNLFLLATEQASDILLGLMSKYHQFVAPDDLREILYKDAVYNALGMAGFEIYTQVDFVQWFNATLKHELKQMEGHYKIIRRRICWFFGEWTSVKMDMELRIQIYGLLVEAMRPEEDLSIRIVASEALKQMLDSFEFHNEDFQAYLDTAIMLLFQLLKDCSECDTQMHVIYVLTAVINRVKEGMEPFISQFQNTFPVMWREAVDASMRMMRRAIIVSLVSLGQALGPSAIVFHSFMADILTQTVNVELDDFVYLGVDALDLWLVLLENAKTLTPEVMNLCKFMPGILDSSLDNMQVGLSIITCYMSFNPKEFVSEWGTEIVNMMKPFYADLTSECLRRCLGIFKMFLIACPDTGAHIMKPILSQMFMFLGDKESKWRDKHEVPSRLCIIIRILLGSQDVFIQMVNEVARQNNASYEEILEKFVSMIISQSNGTLNNDELQVCALGLCKFLDATSPVSIAILFPVMITRIVEILNDLSEEVEDISYCLNSMQIQQEDLSESEDSEEYVNDFQARKHALLKSDPIQYIGVKSFLINQINALERAINAEEMKKILAFLDADVHTQLKELIG